MHRSVFILQPELLTSFGTKLKNVVEYNITIFLEAVQGEICSTESYDSLRIPLFYNITPFPNHTDTGYNKKL